MVKALLPAGIFALLAAAATPRLPGTRRRRGTKQELQPSQRIDGLGVGTERRYLPPALKGG
jgi:hypothetical protein